MHANTRARTHTEKDEERRRLENVKQITFPPNVSIAEVGEVGFIQFGVRIPKPRRVEYL